MALSRRVRPLARLLIVVVALVNMAALVTACAGDGPAPAATGITQTSSPTTGATQPSSQSAVTPSTQPSSSGGDEDAGRLPELEAAVERDPTDLEALEQLGIAYYQAKQYAKAEAAYLKSLDLRDSAEIHNNLGNVYRDWDKPDQAIAQYEKAMELDATLVHPYSNLAGLYMMSSNLERAKEVAQTGIEKTSGAAREQLQGLLDSLQ